MKICFIEPHLQVCGGIRRILEVSNRMRKFGHDVHIFTPRGLTPSWFDNKVPVHKLSKILDYHFDVAVFNLAEQFPICKATLAQKKIFWVLAPEAMYKRPDTPVQALNQGFYLMANSNFTKNYISKYIRTHYDVPIIPGGINPEHFKYDKNIRKVFHVLYYGSKRPWKGGNIIKQAFNHHPLKVQKMEGLGTKQEDMYKLYNSSIVYTSACQAEGFSMPPLEAMACGTVVVCTNEGGNLDYIKNGYNCILVNRDPISIFKGTMKVLQDHNLRETLRQNGLATAKQSKFDWDKITKLFISHIENDVF